MLFGMSEYSVLHLILFELDIYTVCAWIFPASEKTVSELSGGSGCWGISLLQLQVVFLVLFWCLNKFVVLPQ